MVNGQFKCIGSAQHLKTKFGQGLLVTLKMKQNVASVDKESHNEEEMEATRKKLIRNFIADQFENANIK